MNYLLTLDANLVNDMIGVEVEMIRKMIRLEKTQKELMLKLVNDEEIYDGSVDYWINWNYFRGEDWESGFNMFDEYDDEYDNPIYNGNYN
tara:strand:+ start:332 stop:601 length:270 start_codon:yes stop_codon:yes gene_type:complete